MGSQHDPVFWEGRFALGIQIIDRQHEKLVKMVKNLLSIKQERHENDNASFLKNINETANFLQYHFITEEKLMLLLDYREYLSHKEMHGSLLEEAQKLTFAEAGMDHEDLAGLIRLLLESGLHHLETNDRAFADYYFELRESGCLRKTFIIDSARTPILA